MSPVDLDTLVDALRASGARFALLFGSRVAGGATGASDLDVAAWWGGSHPSSWTVGLPDGVDLVVLDEAPLWLAGRVALEGVVLFDDDAATRVAWQADTRLQYLDALPQVLESQREWREAVARGR